MFSCCLQLSDGKFRTSQSRRLFLYLSLSSLNNLEVVLTGHGKDEAEEETANDDIWWVRKAVQDKGEVNKLQRFFGFQDGQNIAFDIFVRGCIKKG